MDRDSILKQLQACAEQEQAVLANLHRVPAAIPFLNDLQKIDGARILCQDWLRQLDQQEAEAAKAALAQPPVEPAAVEPAPAEPAILPFTPPAPPAA
jgi:ABC-type phosphate/phosphonate transport system ATPase subunit